MQRMGCWSGRQSVKSMGNTMKESAAGEVSAAQCTLRAIAPDRSDMNRRRLFKTAWNDSGNERGRE